METIANYSQSHYRKRFEIAAGILALFCLALVFSMEYARGRFSWVTDTYLNSEFGFIAYPWILIIAVAVPYLLGILVIVRGILFYKKAYKDLAISVGFGFLIICTPLIFSAINSPMGPFLWGYTDRVKSQINIPVLQDWATRTINETSDVKSPSINANPPGIGSLTFRGADVFENDGGSQAYIRLMDGGHFIGYYGLNIGRQDFLCSDDQYRLAAGICVWYGGE